MKPRPDLKESVPLIPVCPCSSAPLVTPPLPIELWCDPSSPAAGAPLLETSVRRQHAGVGQHRPQVLSVIVHGVGLVLGQHDGRQRGGTGTCPMTAGTSLLGHLVSGVNSLAGQLKEERFTTTRKPSSSTSNRPSSSTNMPRRRRPPAAPAAAATPAPRRPPPPAWPAAGRPAPLPPPPAPA